MPTGTRREKGIQSALNHTLKTGPGTLPRSRALEDSPAGTPGPARNGAGRNADGQVAREGPGSGRRHGRGSGDPRCGASRVFALDRRGDPPVPCHPARAGKPLKKGRAVAVRLHPFAIRLRDRDGGETQPVDPGIDPGSRRTGPALAGDDGEALSPAEIAHRGKGVRTLMQLRANCRRRRRSAGPHRRKERFLNRRSGRRLPPSLLSRADGALSWTERFGRLAPMTRIRCETARFDTRALESPDIEGAECRQGTLAGREARGHLLERRGRKRACRDAADVPLQAGHVRPEARGSAARRVLFEGLERAGLPVSGSSGGRTESGRARPGVPKTHALDAARVGETPALTGRDRPVPGIRATGRGSHARTRMNRFGFPVGHLMARKSVRGFRTGGILRATVPSGRRQGVHAGRVAVRASGSFNVQAAGGTVQGVPHRRCRIIRRGDGYGHRQDPSPSKENMPMHGTPKSAFLSALKDGASCGVDR